ncbi:MAG: NERD domain-containing protein [Eubacterium sp.]|nr:NERD domain-containing protein [Eubacterium sp.]
MAKIIKKSKELENKYNEKKNEGSGKAALIGALVLIVFLCTVAAFFFSSAVPLVFAGISLLLCVIVIAAGNPDNTSELEILESGIKGERETMRILSRLPDSYTVFLNVRYAENCEADSIVVGKTGVFIVETKNVNGEITGYADENEWSQRKVGRGGTTYGKYLKSPVKQVKRNIYHLSELFKKNGIRTYIEGVVFFSSPEADVAYIRSENNIPVFVYSNARGRDMLNYIVNSDEKLNEKSISKINKLISKL